MAEDYEYEYDMRADVSYRREDRHNGDSEEKHEKVKDKHRDRTRDKERRRRSRSREKKRSDNREFREKKRSRSKEKEYKQIKGASKSASSAQGQFKKQSEPKEKNLRSWSRSPLRTGATEMTPEERDARTIFCMQLSARIRARDLEEFFASSGKVQDVRVITDNKTRRSKGIAYVEFRDVDSVNVACGMTGQRLLGVPIIVQASQGEKNRTAGSSTGLLKDSTGPMRLYVGSLHFNITEEMLKGIFEPFGKIEHINLVMDNETGRSKGFGFVTFHDAENAKKALDQLNGFELAGRPMKVGHVTERTADGQAPSTLDTDEMERAGVDLGATGRLQLMAKLAEGTGFEIPQAAANALNIGPGGLPMHSSNSPPIATQCFMLSNMFDPSMESTPSWDLEIRDDVIDECNKHGGVIHIYVDKASPQGNVYVKCPSIAAAAASVNGLHGRYFAGKVITAAYVPLPNYHSLFPDSLRVGHLELTSAQKAGLGIPVAVTGSVTHVGFM